MGTDRPEVGAGRQQKKRLTEPYAGNFRLYLILEAVHLPAEFYCAGRAPYAVTQGRFAGGFRTGKTRWLIAPKLSEKSA